MTRLLKKKVFAITASLAMVLSLVALPADVHAQTATDANASPEVLTEEGNGIINETQLKEAINKGGEVILNSDIKLTSSLSILKDVTLIGNGHTISVGDTFTKDTFTGKKSLINIDAGYLGEDTSLDVVLKNVNLEATKVGADGPTNTLDVAGNKEVNLTLDNVSSKLIGSWNSPLNLNGKYSKVNVTVNNTLKLDGPLNAAALTGNVEMTFAEGSTLETVGNKKISGRPDGVVKPIIRSNSNEVNPDDYISGSFQDVKAPAVIDIVQKYEAKQDGRIKTTIVFDEPTKVTSANDWKPVEAKDGYAESYVAYFYRTKDITVTFEDAYGNKGEQAIHIDMDAPTLVNADNLSGSPVANRTVTLTFSEAIKAPEGWSAVEGSDGTKWQKTFTKNEKVTMQVEDLVGNPAVVKFEVKNVDSTTPEVVSVELSTEKWTNQDVTVTIKTNTDTNTPEGWKAINKRTFTKTFSENGHYEVYLISRTGIVNDVPYIVSIENIDKTSPVFVSPKNGHQYKEDLKVEIEDASFDRVEVYNYATDETVTYTEKTFTVTEEGKFIMTAYDKAGNSHKIYVSKDTNKPDIHIIGSGKDGYYRAIEGIEVEDDKWSNLRTLMINDHKVDLNKQPYYLVNGDKLEGIIEGENTLVATDMAGNETVVTFVYDTISPVILSPKNGHQYKENLNVEVDDINFDRVEVYNYATDKTEVYTENAFVITTDGKYKITVYDKAGNSAKIWVSKDTQKPTVKIDGIGSQGHYSSVNAIIVYDGGKWTNLSTLKINDYVLDLNKQPYYHVNGNKLQGIVEGNNTLVATDMAGNETVVEFIYDTVAPEVTYHVYGNQVRLKGNEAIIAPSGWTKKAEGLEWRKTLDAGKNYDIVVTDLAGNKVNLTIDRILPEATFTLSNEGKPTNQDVVVTMKVTESLSTTPEGWTKVDATTYTKTYADNANETITLVDEVGNTNNVTLTVEGIDKVAPTATLSYSTVDPTNKDVIATITVDEKLAETPKGWTKVNDTTYTKTFTENGEETVVLKDVAGNITEVTVSVQNIDKVAPEVVKVVPNEDGTVTVKFSEVVAEVEGGDWVLSDKKYEDDGKYWIGTLTEDKIYDVTAYDLAGNSVTFQVDHETPKAKVEYSTTEPTNGEVTVTVHFANEKYVVLTSSTANPGWTKVDDTTYTKTYSENATESVKFHDGMGNTTTVAVSVQNIDKEAPKGEVTYSTTEWTNKDVVATITVSEELAKTPKGWTKASDNTYTKTFTENGEETVVLEDLAGNTTEVAVSVQNIDKVAAEAEITYSTTDWTNEDVLATIKANEEVNLLGKGWIYNDVEDCFEKVIVSNGEETVVLVDKAGNETEVKVNVENIDKVAPEAEVIYSTTDWTNEDVLATIKANEEVNLLGKGWVYNEKEDCFEKVIASNGEETVVLVDRAGNQTEVAVSAANVDKTAPEVEVTYSTTKPTREDVTVTIKANEVVNLLGKGWVYNEKEDCFEKVYTSNGKEKVVIVDRAGNETEVEVSVQNIDKSVIKPDDSVDTGDNSRTGLYASMTIASVLGLAVLFVLKRKKELEQE